MSKIAGEIVTCPSCAESKHIGLSVVDTRGGTAVCVGCDERWPFVTPKCPSCGARKYVGPGAKGVVGGTATCVSCGETWTL